MKKMKLSFKNGLVIAVLFFASAGIAKVAPIAKPEVCDVDASQPQGSQAVISYSGAAASIKGSDGSVTKVQPSVVEQKVIINTEGK